jgi:hypothetical protein
MKWLTLGKAMDKYLANSSLPMGLRLVFTRYYFRALQRSSFIPV